MTGIREIRGPDNRFYGFIITQQMGTVSTQLVDENAMQLSWQRTPNGGNPE